MSYVSYSFPPWPHELNLSWPSDEEEEDLPKVVSHPTLSGRISPEFDNLASTERVMPFKILGSLRTGTTTVHYIEHNCLGSSSTFPPKLLIDKPQPSG